MKNRKEKLEKRALVEKALKNLMERKEKPAATNQVKKKEPPRKTKLFDCLSRITITDQCPRQYLEAILLYEEEISAKLDQKAV